MEFIDRLVASPCCNPDLGVEEALAAYSRLGFRCYEVFTSWAAGAFDWTRDPAGYLDLGRAYNLRFTSLHLPPVDDDLETSLPRAVEAARFAVALGVEVVLFKATSRENYVRAAGRFLDAIDALPLTPVLQNHAGSPISTLDDFRQVLDGIDDSRMKGLLEVGHFHAVGVPWVDGFRLLEGRIALVHIKDQLGARSVPFGQGEIDLPALFRHLRNQGYDGRFVVEMEVEDRENTLRYLAEALEYLKTHCQG